MNEFGLIEYFMMVAAVAMSWGMYYATQPPPANVEKNPELLAAPTGVAGTSSDPVSEPSVGGGLSETLQLIRRAGGYADTEAFLEGAKLAYERIMKAYAAGDMAEQANLLSGDVRDAFAKAVEERNVRRDTVSLFFIGFRSATITDAGLGGGQAWIDVRFVAELVSATRDSTGRVVAGHPARVVDIAEVWTFERSLRASAPDWLLTATAADE